MNLISIKPEDFGDVLNRHEDMLMVHSDCLNKLSSMIIELQRDVSALKKVEEMRWKGGFVKKKEE